jgi:hypothetical protein
VPGKHAAPGSPLHPPTWLVTYMRGVGLGGSCSLEHGLSEVMEARAETLHPLGSARGSQSEGPHEPCPACRVGVFTGKGLGGCGWDFP